MQGLSLSIVGTIILRVLSIRVKNMQNELATPTFTFQVQTIILTEDLDKQLRIKISNNNYEWRFDDLFFIFKF